MGYVTQTKVAGTKHNFIFLITIYCKLSIFLKMYHKCDVTSGNAQSLYIFFILVETAYEARHLICSLFFFHASSVSRNQISKRSIRLRRFCSFVHLASTASASSC